MKIWAALAVAGTLALAVRAAPTRHGDGEATMQQEHASALEPGALPARWTYQQVDCTTAPAFQVHEYNATFHILRQSGCTNFEKPFLYLVIGTKQALLVDTGAAGADVVPFVDAVLRRDAQSRGRAASLPLLVIHSHGHGDHTAGDPALSARADTTVVSANPGALEAVCDIGGRVLDIVPIPGHEPASVAIYDRRTGILLTGDTLYPGRLYVRDAAAFKASVDRLVAFTADRPIAYVLGAHIENTRTPYKDYPEGTKFQPDEHPLELGRAHLLELADALVRMGTGSERRVLRDFTIWPVAAPAHGV